MVEEAAGKAEQAPTQAQPKPERQLPHVRRGGRAQAGGHRGHVPLLPGNGVHGARRLAAAQRVGGAAARRARRRA